MRRRSSQKRLDRLIKEKRKDTYKATNTMHEPAYCTECGATYINGRWTWKELDEEKHQTICPACKRTVDKYPAGYIEIKGNFFSRHANEISNLIRNTEKLEKTERPLERIMSRHFNRNKAVLTTTGIHIARRIGEALFRSYQGEFNFQYADGDKSIRVFWER